MPSIKKTKPITPLPEREIVLAAFKILILEWKYTEYIKTKPLSPDDKSKFLLKINEMQDDLQTKYDISFGNVMYLFHHTTIDVDIYMKKKGFRIEQIFARPEDNLDLIPDSITGQNLTPEILFEYHTKRLSQSNIEPTKIGSIPNSITSHVLTPEIVKKMLRQSNVELTKIGSTFSGYGEQYAFKGFYYSIKGHYTEDQIRLLILEDFDKERQRFEKLKTKFDDTYSLEFSYERPRIPESVRVEVWRRDGGKCARCGSREKLEYDHIVPISRGGSNTARNIELLCEKHNRSKSNNVV